jgi:hypothetical protein
MADAEKGFARRWSRRKQKARVPESPESAEAPDEQALAALPEGAPPAARDDGLEEGPAAPRDLPDIETLDENSDFSAFLQKGVPDVIRRKALRRLWRVNPLVRIVDGLDDYDEDFTDAAMVVEGMKSLYQAGKGYPDEEPGEEKKPAEAEGEEIAESAGQSDAQSERESGAESEAESEATTLAEEAAEVAETGLENTPLESAREERMTLASQAGDAESGAPAQESPARKRSARQRRWGQVVDK